MKIGLYSITYLGMWYRGAALPLEEMIGVAKKFGYDGIEIDGKRPHGTTPRSARLERRHAPTSTDVARRRTCRRPN